MFSLDFYDFLDELILYSLTYFGKLAIVGRFTIFIDCIFHYGIMEWMEIACNSSQTGQRSLVVFFYIVTQGVNIFPFLLQTCILCLVRLPFAFFICSILFEYLKEFSMSYTKKEGAFPTAEELSICKMKTHLK